MATGETPLFNLPYPILTDPVNVHEDIQELAESIELLLPILTDFVSSQNLEVKNVSGVSIAKADPVYVTGFSTKTTVAKSIAEDFNTFPIIGIARAAIGNGTDGTIILNGIFEDLNTNSFEVGDVLYVATGGGLTSTQPTSGSGAIAVVAKKDSISGIIIVGQPKGNGTWGSLKAGLS